MAHTAHEDAVQRLEVGLLEQDRCSERYDAAIGTSSEQSAYAQLRAAGARVAAHPGTYAAVVHALLKDGPLQGKTVEVEAVEGRPPKTIDAPDEQGDVCRYCLEDWTQEGMTAVYTFLYTV